MSPSPTSTAGARKQALQEQVLATIRDRRLAGIALTMGVGKTLLALRDMDRLLATPPAARPAGKPFLVAAPTRAVLAAWSEEAYKFNFTHLLAYIDFTTYRFLPKVLAVGTYHKLYLDECHALKESHEPSLRAHVARNGHILGLTGTPPGEGTGEKARLVATYCPIVVDYTTDEAILAGLLNDYRLVVHQLALRPVRGYTFTSKAGQTYVTSKRKHYQYWSSRLARAQAGDGVDALPLETLRLLRMRALMDYPTKGHYGLPKEFANPTGHDDLLLASPSPCLLLCGSRSLSPLAG